MRARLVLRQNLAPNVERREINTLTLFHHDQELRQLGLVSGYTFSSSSAPQSSQTCLATGVFVKNHMRL